MIFTDIDAYHVATWLGRFYLISLFIWGLVSLTRLRVWTLWFVYIFAAGAYLGFNILTALSPAPSPRPYRLLGVYGIAVCVHVLLMVLNNFIKQYSIKRLRPLDNG